MISIVKEVNLLEKCFVIGKGFVHIKGDLIKAAEEEDWDKIDDLFIKLAIHVGKMSMCNAKEVINLRKIHQHIKKREPIYIKDLIE